MDFAVTAVAAPAQQAAPRYVPDMRPAADAAAQSRDPRPHVPMPMPALAATVSTPGAADSRPDRVQALKEPERILKPYGVTMLPHSARQQKEKADQAEAGQHPDRAASARDRPEDAAPREPSRAAPQSVTEAMTQSEGTAPRAAEREDRDQPRRERATLPGPQQEAKD